MVRASRTLVTGFVLTGLVLVAIGGIADAEDDEKKQIVFIHGKASHGYGGHAYGAAFRMLARILNENAPAVNAVVVQDDQDLALLDKADAIVLGSDGGRLVKTLGDRLEPLMNRGVGLACIHYTVDPADPDAVARLIAWIGGAYERHWSVNPHWEADFKSFPDHPTARGLKLFKARDEWYYHMRFVEGMEGVTPLLSAVPPENTRQRPDGPHSGNPHVRAQSGMAEVVGWVYERPGGGRGLPPSGRDLRSVLGAARPSQGTQHPTGNPDCRRTPCCLDRRVARGNSSGEVDSRHSITPATRSCYDSAEFLALAGIVLLPCWSQVAVCWKPSLSEKVDPDSQENAGGEAPNVFPPVDILVVWTRQESCLDRVDLENQPDGPLEQTGDFREKEDDPQEEDREHAAARLEREITAKHSRDRSAGPNHRPSWIVLHDGVRHDRHDRKNQVERPEADTSDP